MKNVHQEPPHTWRTSLIFLRFLRFLMGILTFEVIFIQMDFASAFQKCIILGVLSKNGCQEPPQTLKMSLIFLTFLRFLTGILMFGVIFIQEDYAIYITKMYCNNIKMTFNHYDQQLSISNMWRWPPTERREDTWTGGARLNRRSCLTTKCLF